MFDRLSIFADRGGIAAGRDVTFGLDEEGVRRVLQEELSRIASEKGVSAIALQAILAKIGETSIPESQIPVRLDAAADELNSLRAQLKRPEFSEVHATVLSLLDAGKFDEARDALAPGREAARKLREEGGRVEADFLAEAARIDRLQFAYRDAAAKYREAAAAVRGFDVKRERDLLSKQAISLYLQGSEFGDNECLDEAIATLRRVLPLASDKLGLACTLNDLGSMLEMRGRRQTAGPDIEEAIRLFRTALEEVPRQQFPGEWKLLQANLGVALCELGTQVGVPARIEEAVAVLHEALTERARADAPDEWLQESLGVALMGLGKQDTARLIEAVEVFRAAFKMRKRRSSPHEWANTLSLLGSALQTLGDRTRNVTLLQKAVQAYHGVLAVYTRERSLVDWIEAKHDLGNVFALLGKRNNSTTDLEAAIRAYHDALEEATPDRMPLYWSKIKISLASALTDLGRAREDKTIFEEAINELSDAGSIEGIRQLAPQHWADAQQNLGIVLREVGRFEEAINAFTNSLTVNTRTAAPRTWAAINYSLALVYRSQGSTERNIERTIEAIEKAIGAYRAALSEEAFDGNAREYAEKSIIELETFISERRTPRTRPD